MRKCIASAVSWGLLASMIITLTACKPAIDGGGKLFNTATPEIRTAWETAIAAAKTNDFALAITTLQRLRAQPGITPEQTQAIDHTSSALNDKMYDAANQGDAKAKQAINDLRLLHSR